MNRQRLFFYVPTALLSLLMLFSAGMYLFNTGEIHAEFTALGFPTWIVFPLAIAKLAGVLILWIRPNRALVEWTYAGFFFDFLLALGAHLSVNDGDYPAAIAALVLLGASRFWLDRVTV
jgi:hypothetical protein